MRKQSGYLCTQLTRALSYQPTLSNIRSGQYHTLRPPKSFLPPLKKYSTEILALWMKYVVRIASSWYPIRVSYSTRTSATETIFSAHMVAARYSRSDHPPTKHTGIVLTIRIMVVPLALRLATIVSSTRCTHVLIASKNSLLYPYWRNIVRRRVQPN